VTSVRILGGPRARAHVAEHGLRPSDLRAIAAAAGGPKGLGLIPFDRWLFGEFLANSTHASPILLAGASIGAWRMAAASQRDPAQALDRLLQAYLELQRYRELPERDEISVTCRAIVRDLTGADAQAFLAGRAPGRVLQVVTARERSGKSLHSPRTSFGLAALSNALGRDHLAGHLQRVLFSDGGQGQEFQELTADHFESLRIGLEPSNLEDALLASGSIPLVANPVCDIPGAPKGCYWDGGLIDYHLYWRWSALDGLVLYPHFAPQLTAGWLDKYLPWRQHGIGEPGNGWLDNVLLVVPSPELLARLPNRKLPDRMDFHRYGTDHDRRLRDWRYAINECARMAEDFAAFVARPDPRQIEAL
jgi:hypothetical protein